MYIFCSPSKRLVVSFGKSFQRTIVPKMAKSKFEYVKDFESDEKCLPNCWIVVRLDGKGFHKFSDVHNFERPNDKRGLDLMSRAAASVFEDLHDLCFAFGHSDEYSFVFRKNTQLFNRRHDKLLTLVNSKFSSSYVFYWREYFGSVKMEYPPAFDGRVVLYPTDENLRDYLSWRQADVHVNNLHNTVFWALVQKKSMTTKEANKRLEGTVSSEKNEMLFSEFNMNYNNEPEQFKKGTSLIRKVMKVNEKNSLVVCPLHVDIIKKNFWDENPEILGCKPAGVLNLNTATTAGVLESENTIATIPITPKQFVS